MGEHPSITKEAFNKTWYQISDFLNNFSSLGKNALMNRSRSYKAVIAVLRKVDADIRKNIERQKRIIKLLNRSKKKMELATFAQNVNDFLNTQEAILVLLRPEVSKEFNNILQHVKYELFKNPNAKRVAPFNPHESVQRVLQNISDAGVTAGGAGFDASLSPLDWKERARTSLAEQEKQKKLREKERKNSKKAEKAEAINEFIKSGGMFDWYFSGRHYRNLKEGEELYTAMDNITNAIEAVFENNDQTYKELHTYFSKGDPKAYLDAMSSLAQQTGAATASILNDYEKYIEPLAQQTPNTSSVIKPEEVPEVVVEPEQKPAVPATSEPEPKQPLIQTPNTAPAPVETQQNQEPVQAPAKAPEQTPEAAPVVSVPVEQPKVETVPETTAPVSEQAKKTKPKGLPRKRPAKAKAEAAEQALELITKTALDGDPYAVAVQILKFANEIEEDDEELADQLTAIAESVING